jgi:uncharacterized protein (TIGR03437 family)
MQQRLRKRLGWAALAFAAFPISAFADLSDTKTLTATQSLNLETGAIATTGGDILWSGTSITPQGTAKAGVVPGITGVSGFALLDQATLQALVSLGSSSAIPSSSLPVGTIVGVATNATHVAKLLVTANSGSSITLQFTTFGATGGSGGPSITNVLNNSSEIPAGFPNSGIAQGSLFKILGSGLSDAGDANLHDSVPGLPSTLNGASINVQSGSTTIHPALYYATPTQIDGVLPSSFPTGPATVTVSYKGAASNSFNINVVAAAPGFTLVPGTTTAIAQDASRPSDPYGGLVTLTKSAAPGAVITLWGTGFGATGNSDTTYDTSAHQTTVPYQLYIGGVLVTNLAYKGASVYPGVNVVQVTIPANVPTGCYVPVAAVATVNGSVIVSNIGTLPIHAGGGTCSDPQFGINGDQISAITGPTKTGFLVVQQSTAPVTGVSNTAFALFQQTPGISSPAGGSVVSIGGCVISQTTTGGTIVLPTGLNAGTILVTGPGGSPVTLTGISQLPGFYSATLASIPSTGGAYVFNGTAGSQVGAFSATVTFPNPLLVWTNQNAAGNVGRTQGFTATWTGGAPGSYVIISGTSASGSVSGGYTCYAPQSAGTFTVPSYILASLPAGSGTTTVQNSTNLGAFSASGLDFGATLGNVAFTVNSTFN